MASEILRGDRRVALGVLPVRRLAFAAAFYLPTSNSSYSLSLHSPSSLSVEMEAGARSDTFAVSSGVSTCHN